MWSLLRPFLLVLLILSLLPPAVLARESLDEPEHGDHGEADGAHADHEDSHAHGGKDEHGHGGEDEHAHGSEDEHGHGASNVVVLDEARQRAAGIAVAPLALQPLPNSIQAPGEVQFHGYRSSKITPRVAAQIVKRHARQGDKVQPGQRLVTLSSVEVAQAQGERLVAAREWTRVQKLGKEVASERRYVEASVAYQQSGARLRAFGLSEEQVDAISRGEVTAQTGSFDLLATQAGTVVADDFVDGEFVEPGRVLFEIADESLLWVESRVSPAMARELSAGANATIVTREGQRIPAKVSQLGHRIDEQTRLLTVRVEVENRDDRLHPGEFVTAEFAGNGTQNALALPQEAVVRTSAGTWAVFVATQPGTFTQTPVTVQRNVGKRVVIDGVAAGTPVVTAGAFLLASELAKGGFDPHNH